MKPLFWLGVELGAVMMGEARGFALLVGVLGLCFLVLDLRALPFGFRHTETAVVLGGEGDFTVSKTVGRGDNDRSGELQPLGGGNNDDLAGLEELGRGDSDDSADSSDRRRARPGFPRPPDDDGADDKGNSARTGASTLAMGADFCHHEGEGRGHVLSSTGALINGEVACAGGCELSASSFRFSMTSASVRPAAVFDILDRVATVCLSAPSCRNGAKRAVLY